MLADDQTFSPKDSSLSSYSFKDIIYKTEIYHEHKTLNAGVSSAVMKIFVDINYTQGIILHV